MGRLQSDIPKDQLQFLKLREVFFLFFLGWAMGIGGSLFSLRKFLKPWAS